MSGTTTSRILDSVDSRSRSVVQRLQLCAPHAFTTGTELVPDRLAMVRHSHELDDERRGPRVGHVLPDRVERLISIRERIDLVHDPICPASKHGKEEVIE